MGSVNPGFAVLVPVRNGAAGLMGLHDELSRILGKSAGRFGRGELVLVDDGSEDGTWETMIRMARGGNEDLLPVRGFRLGDGRGQQAALMAGLTKCRGVPVVTMDDDSAHPPDAVPDLLAAIEDGADAAYAHPPARPGRGMRRAASRLHQLHLSLLTGASARIKVGSFRAMSPELIERILASAAPYPYLSAQILCLRPRPRIAMVSGNAWENGGKGRFPASSLLRMEFRLAWHYGPAARAIRSLADWMGADGATAGEIASGWISEETAPNEADSNRIAGKTARKGIAP